MEDADEFEYAFTMRKSGYKIYRHKTNPHRLKVEMPDFKNWTEHLQNEMDSGRVSK